MTCPDCGGKKFRTGFACPGMRPYKRPCPMCGATGEVSDVVADWIRRGQEMRADRIARDMSIREEAARLGIGPAALSDMEMGRVEPFARTT